MPAKRHQKALIGAFQGSFGGRKHQKDQIGAFQAGLSGRGPSLVDLVQLYLVDLVQLYLVDQVQRPGPAGLSGAEVLDLVQHKELDLVQG